MSADLIEKMRWLAFETAGIDNCARNDDNGDCVPFSDTFRDAADALEIALQERDVAMTQANRTLETAQAVDRAATRLEAHKSRLQTALRYFLADDRFDVTVGGNPAAVDKAVNYARMALAVVDNRPSNNSQAIETAKLDNPPVSMTYQQFLAALPAVGGRTPLETPVMLIVNGTAHPVDDVWFEPRQGGTGAICIGEDPR